MTKEETKYCQNCKRCKQIYYSDTYRVKCSHHWFDWNAIHYCKHKKERKD